ncbi:hypothetical protein ACHWQZ_G011352 [Mnemiopsis leidyi]
MGIIYKFRLLSAALLLIISIKSNRASKEDQQNCLKNEHILLGVDWGRDLSKRAKKEASMKLEARISDQSLLESSSSQKFKRSTIRYTEAFELIEDFAMTSLSCTYYIRKYESEIAKMPENTKVGCAVDWDHPWIVVYCLYKHVDVALVN